MRQNHISRVIAMLLCVVLLLGSLVSCGPNLSGVKGDELRGYNALKTEN